jgi:hypothetical protein
VAPFHGRSGPITSLTRTFLSRPRNDAEPHNRARVAELHDPELADSCTGRRSSACSLALTLLCPFATHCGAPWSVAVTTAAPPREKPWLNRVERSHAGPYKKVRRSHQNRRRGHGASPGNDVPPGADSGRGAAWYQGHSRGNLPCNPPREPESRALGSRRAGGRGCSRPRLPTSATNGKQDGTLSIRAHASHNPAPPAGVFAQLVTGVTNTATGELRIRRWIAIKSRTLAGAISRHTSPRNCPVLRQLNE